MLQSCILHFLTLELWVTIRKLQSPTVAPCLTLYILIFVIQMMTSSFSVLTTLRTWLEARVHFIRLPQVIFIIDLSHSTTTITTRMAMMMVALKEVIWWDDETGISIIRRDKWQFLTINYLSSLDVAVSIHWQSWSWSDADDYFRGVVVVLLLQQEKFKLLNTVTHLSF